VRPIDSEAIWEMAEGAIGSAGVVRCTGHALNGRYKRARVRANARESAAAIPMISLWFLTAGVNQGLGRQYRRRAGMKTRGGWSETKHPQTHRCGER
jgi:hypothetical protein